jgi:hypothetical protein
LLLLLLQRTDERQGAWGQKVVAPFFYKTNWRKFGRVSLIGEISLKKLKIRKFENEVTLEVFNRQE